MPYDDDTNVVDSLFGTVLHAALLAKVPVRSIVFDSPYDQFDLYDPLHLGNGPPYSRV